MDKKVHKWMNGQYGQTVCMGQTTVLWDEFASRKEETYANPISTENGIPKYSSNPCCGGMYS